MPDTGSTHPPLDIIRMKIEDLAASSIQHPASSIQHPVSGVDPGSRY